MEGVAAYIAGWSIPAIICLVAGVILLIMEMFTPGFGVAGITGLILLIATIILRADTLANALITTAIVVVLIVIAGIVFVRSLKKGALNKSPIVLKDASLGESTPLSDESMQRLVGLEGEALTQLRPTGKVKLSDDNTYDVMSAGEFIQKGSRVLVERVEGLRILVKAKA